MRENYYLLGLLGEASDLVAGELLAKPVQAREGIIKHYCQIGYIGPLLKLRDEKRESQSVTISRAHRIPEARNTSGEVRVAQIHGHTINA